MWINSAYGMQLSEWAETKYFSAFMGGLPAGYGEVRGSGQLWFLMVSSVLWLHPFQQFDFA